MAPEMEGDLFKWVRYAHTSMKNLCGEKILAQILDGMTRHGGRLCKHVVLLFTVTRRSLDEPANSCRPWGSWSAGVAESVWIWKELEDIH